MTGALTVQPATLPAQAMQFGQGFATQFFQFGSAANGNLVGSAYSQTASADGQFVLYYSSSASGTLTLPSSGISVGYRTLAFNASSAPYTLTVSTGGTAHIFGPGWPYVLSGTLGPDEFVQLEFDGVNWEVFGGSASPLGLGALSTAAYPGAGIVQSSGTALSPVTIGTGLSLSSGTLSANVSSYAVATPASGATVSVATYSGLFYTQQINPTNTVTALTVNLPASETDGERVTIASNASMSGVVLVPPSGQTLGPNMPTAISAGTGFTLQVQAGVWERVQ